MFNTHPPDRSPPRLLVDAREAARLLAISPRKLWSLTKSGEVPSMRVGRVVRYRVDDLEAWTRRMVTQVSVPSSACAIAAG